MKSQGILFQTKSGHPVAVKALLRDFYYTCSEATKLYDI